MLSDLTQSYLAELDARAAAGDTRARDYGDVCRLEFEQHLERCVIALAKRDREEGRAEWTMLAAPVATRQGRLFTPWDDD
jgi:hypothetical protein